MDITRLQENKKTQVVNIDENFLKKYIQKNQKIKITITVQ